MKIQNISLTYHMANLQLLNASKNLETDGYCNIISTDITGNNLYVEFFKILRKLNYIFDEQHVKDLIDLDADNSGLYNLNIKSNPNWACKINIYLSIDPQIKTVNILSKNKIIKMLCNSKCTFIDIRRILAQHNVHLRTGQFFNFNNDVLDEELEICYYRNENNQIQVEYIEQ